ncbi:glycosyltransferase [Flavobacterium sp. J27]|uniref:glycosyltransferase family 2 protein n=1 Tax=Flavobacterium sp. J27 TaxID=2060419 RepID=UPI0010324807|nr:glycosyltransferase [Flavobacterium sp. J27]
MKRLSVIMPVYNGELYIEEAIESILNQTFTNFNLIILNDNSTDSTVKIIEKFQEKDDRIILISKTKNLGPANLRNEGIDIADTEYVALLDADDIALSTRFEKQIKVLDSNPNLGLCGTWFTIFGDKKEKVLRHEVEHDALKVQFLYSCGLGNSTVMFRKSALGDLRFEHQYVPAEDYGLWSEFIAKSYFYNIPESLVRYRWHPGNISQTKEENLRIAEVAIKKRQLERLEISSNDPKSIYYVNAVCLKRKQTPEDIIGTITAAKVVLEKNKKLGIYHQAILTKHIDEVIIRTIRNASSYHSKFYTFIKKESGYFKKMPLLDKIMFFFKCKI